MTSSTARPAAEARPAAPDVMVQVEGLTKHYGPFVAIENVSFHIRRGEILGFLGPNGAGKTTTMRILAGFFPPTSGAASIAGFNVVEQSLDARRNLGYLPETVPLYTDMTVADYLAYMGALRGMPRHRLRQRIAEVIELTRVGDYRDVLIGKLSKGFRQRVGIAQAILHQPPVLILDEPTIGIDPIQVVETRQLIRDLGGLHTILLSSHILPEVSMVCQRVVIIHEGQVVAEDQPQRLAQRLQGVERVELEVRGPAAQVAQALRNVKGVLEVSRQGDGDVARFTVEARRGADVREQLGKAVVEGGWGLLRLQPLTMTLEEVFLKLTTEDAGKHA